MHHPFRCLSAMLLSAMLAVSAASAQSVDTGILGTVVDASGAVIPGSDITVTRVSTGVVQSIVSGANGSFEVRYLVPGEYVVEARLSGFRSERRAVTLRVGQMARLNVVLEVGQIGEVVDVVAKGLLLETQSGVTGNVVTAETIVNLPMSGRNITSGTTPSMRAISSRALRSPSRSSSAISSEGSSADQSFAARRSSWDPMRASAKLARAPPRPTCSPPR
jgi:hypothetical protein